MPEKEKIFIYLKSLPAPERSGAQGHARQKGLSRRLEQRGRLGQLLREHFFVYIDPHADHHIVNAVDLRAHLRQDTRRLPPVQHQIVGPFQAHRSAALPRAGGAAWPRAEKQGVAGLRRRKAHHQRQHGSPLRPDAGPQKKAHIYGLSGRRAPVSPPASPAGCLLPGADQRAVGRSFLRQPLRLEVRRVNAVEADAAPAHDRRLKPAPDLRLRHHIRQRLQPIAPVGDAVDLIALFL